MLIRRLDECPEIVAGDNTRLRELLHPHSEEYRFGARYSLAVAEVEKGQQTLKHRLVRSNEVYYVLQGEGEMHIDDDTATIRRGDAVEIPAGSAQWIRNTSSEKLMFLCIVDPAWTAVDEEVLD